MSRTVVVTGCSTGFGRLVSEQLARKWDRVYATMRSTKETNAKIAAELLALAAAELVDLRILDQLGRRTRRLGVGTKWWALAGHVAVES